jgi:hypothetical protein
MIAGDHLTFRITDPDTYTLAQFTFRESQVLGSAIRNEYIKLAEREGNVLLTRALHHPVAVQVSSNARMLHYLHSHCHEQSNKLGLVSVEAALVSAMMKYSSVNALARKSIAERRDLALKALDLLFFQDKPVDSSSELVKNGVLLVSIVPSAPPGRRTHKLKSSAFQVIHASPAMIMMLMAFLDLQVRSVTTSAALKQWVGAVSAVLLMLLNERKLLSAGNLVKCLVGKPCKLVGTNLCTVDSKNIALVTAKKPVPATVSTEASHLPMADVAVMVNGPRAPFADVAVVLKCATPSVLLIQVKHTVAKTVGVDLWDELDKLGGGKSKRSLRSQGTLKHLVTTVKAPRGGDKRCTKPAKGMPKAHYVLVTNAEAVRKAARAK